MEIEEIAALASQYDAVDGDSIEVVEAVDEVEEVEEVEFIEEVDGLDEELEQNPPGFIDNIEDWTAAGKDPEMFKGKKAYEAEYQRIQDNKELASTVKAMQVTLKATVDAVSQREEATNARHQKELEAALSRAREDGDTEAALDAADQLRDIKSQPPKQSQQTHPVISDFIEKNPVLMSEEVQSEFARLYNGKLKADGVGASDQLSEAALKGYARAAMAGVKQTYPEKFASPKNQRQNTVKVKAKPTAKAPDLITALKAYKIDGVSSTNSQAPLGVYNTILANNGKDAAENFARNLLGIKK